MTQLLFYERPVPLSPERHGDLRLAVRPDHHRFAAGVHAIPVTGTDSVANAKVAVARGTGLLLDVAGLTVKAVTTALGDVLDDPAHRRASGEVAAEIAAMPPPVSVIGPLTRLLGPVTG